VVDLDQRTVIPHVRKEPRSFLAPRSWHGGTDDVGWRASPAASERLETAQSA
jgi:hypothetical protein